MPLFASFFLRAPCFVCFLKLIIFKKHITIHIHNKALLNLILIKLNRALHFIKSCRLTRKPGYVKFKLNLIWLDLMQPSKTALRVWLYEKQLGLLWGISHSPRCCWYVKSLLFSYDQGRWRAYWDLAFRSERDGQKPI